MINFYCSEMIWKCVKDKDSNRWPFVEFGHHRKMSFQFSLYLIPMNFYYIHMEDNRYHNTNQNALADTFFHFQNIPQFFDS